MDINRISTNQKHKHHQSQVSPLPFPVLSSSVNESFVFWLALYSQPTAGSRLEGKTPHTYETLEHVIALSPCSASSAASWRKKDFCCLNMKAYKALLVLFSVYFSSISPLVSLCFAFKTLSLFLLLLSSHFPLVFDSSTVYGKIWLIDDGKDIYSQLFLYILGFIEK